MYIGETNMRLDSVPQCEFSFQLESRQSALQCLTYVRIWPVYTSTTCPTYKCRYVYVDESNREKGNILHCTSNFLEKVADSGKIGSVVSD